MAPQLGDGRGRSDPPHREDGGELPVALQSAEARRDARRPLEVEFAQEVIVFGSDGLGGHGAAVGVGAIHVGAGLPFTAY